jgi:hypothetical protein
MPALSFPDGSSVRLAASLRMFGMLLRAARARPTPYTTPEVLRRGFLPWHEEVVSRRRVNNVRSINLKVCAELYLAIPVNQYCYLFREGRIGRS